MSIVEHQEYLPEGGLPMRALWLLFKQKQMDFNIHPLGFGGSTGNRRKKGI